MNFDLVYKEIGGFGLFQKYVVLLINLPYIYIAFIFFGSFFILQIPKHRCAIPDYENDTFAVQNDFHQLLINRSIPKSSNDESSYDQCHVFPVDVKYGSDNHPVNATGTLCNSWVYDESIFEETLGAKLNLVCDRKVFKSNAQMMFFAGVLTGSLVTGLLSDRFGRKPVFCIFSFALVVAATAIAWTPDYIYFVVLNYLVGALSVGNFMPVFVLGLEFVGPMKRKISACVGGLVFVVGSLLLSWMGYSIRHLHRLQLACAIPGIVFISFWWILPESPRWLYSVGRVRQSEQIAKLVAKYNRKVFPKDLFHTISQESCDEPIGKLWHLFSNKTLCIRTLVLFFNWIVICLAFFGLAFNSGNLGGDLFLNFTLNALMDLPGTIAILILIDRTGRKPLHTACMLIGGVACISTTFTMYYGGKDLESLTITLAMIGKAGVSAGFSTIYIYSAELFPTQVRNAGMGASSCMARIGAMVAPYIADMSNLVGNDGFGKVLPMLIFGMLSVVAGLLTLLLPETFKRHLPETIKDTMDMDR